MLGKILSRFIKFDDIVGSSDELSFIMQKLVDDGSLTEKRAYEIKEQLTREFNEGKVQERHLSKRLSFLKSGIDFPYEVGILKENIESSHKICPYCFQPAKKRAKYCNICGYDLVHEEEPNFDDVILVDSKEELNLSSIFKAYLNLSEDFDMEDVEIIELNDETDENSDIHFKTMTEFVNELNELYMSVLHSFDDEHSNRNSNKIDLFSIITSLNEGSDFNQAYNETYINSKLEPTELFDLAVDKNFITLNEKITDNGYEFVIQNEWMFFYKYYLSSFNFDDFEHFYRNNNYSLEISGLKFLDKHIRIAEDKKDFYRLVDSYSAKGHIYDHIQKYNKSLRYELKVFIINLNPLYLDEDQLKSHVPLDLFNVDSLCNFSNVYSTAKIKKLFNKEWKSIKFDKTIIPKKESWKILSTLLKGKDVVDYCEEIEKKYFS